MDKELYKRIREKDATVGVVGLGYVGLPLVITFARAGYQILGFDIDEDKVSQLNAGKSFIRHIESKDIAQLVDSKTFRATTHFSDVSECDAIILCVPTPLSVNREPDVSYIEKTAKQIGPYLQSGQLVVLESTTYPGTTRELLVPSLEDLSGLKVGTDLFVAYSPEREDPGNADYGTATIPKVVGGQTPTCAELATELYRSAIEKVVPVTSTETAEMTKLFENVFRSVNIALVNELKTICHAMNIDPFEVINTAATKPFGFMPFYPGPGLGGHCIPIDPFYLTWKAREYGLNTRFIELAGEINTSMPRYVISRTIDALNNQGKALKGANILVIGLAYKKDVDDLRESPSVTLIEMLQERGAEVCYHDPYVPKPSKMRQHALDLTSVPLTDEILQNADAVMIATDHTNIDYDHICAEAKLVIDTRYATKQYTGSHKHIVHA